MEVNVPKVFISYSWSMSDRVLEFANRLMRSGIYVILDKWDLKEGQDKFVFMEQCVTNAEIDNVLIICDKTYMEKSNARTDGVGSETQIISPEVYGKAKQEKFIPIIFELDKDNKPCVPTYLKPILYFDLSSDEKYEFEFERLIRSLHNKPLYKRPILGKMPEWIETDSIDLSEIRDLIKQTKLCANTNYSKSDYLIRKSKEAFLFALNEVDTPIKDANDILDVIDRMKPIRDLLVEYIEALIYFGIPTNEIISNLFEYFFNETYKSHNTGFSFDSDYEHYKFFIWESYISMTATLINYEKFTDLGKILSHTYFTKENAFDESSVSENTYRVFRHHMRLIEDKCKPKCDQPNLITLAGRILVQREKKPILTTQTLSGADVLLYQLHDILNPNSSDYDYWYPTSYIYFKGGNTMWSRLKSKEYCNKIKPLFAAEGIDDLKIKIRSWKEDKDMRYPGGLNSPPTFANSINLDQIASLN